MQETHALGIQYSTRYSSIMFAASKGVISILVLIFSYAGTYISFTFLFVSCLTYLCVDLKGRATSGPVAMLTIFLSKIFKPTLDLWLDCRELEVPIPELTTDTTCEVLHFVKIPYKGNTLCL